MAYTIGMTTEDKLLRCTGFDWDDANVPKIWERHQASPMECEEVFFNLPLASGHDEKPSHEERRYYVLSQSEVSPTGSGDSSSWSRSAKGCCVSSQQGT